MCSICDGETFEEYIAKARLRIGVYGYMMCGVNDAYVYPWVYTAGLADARDHPELIIAGASLETNALICKAMSETVMSGDRFEVGETLRVAGRRVRIGAVADVQYELDTFNMWHELREAGVLNAPRLSAVQVLVADVPRTRTNRRDPRRFFRIPRPGSVLGGCAGSDLRSWWPGPASIR